MIISMVGTANHGRQTAVLATDTSDEVIPGCEIYKLLMEKGAIGTDGQFIWDSSNNADNSVRSEVTSFWNEDGLSFADKMEEAAIEQLNLPEDIMPAFHDLMKDRDDQGAGKKQKKAWGHVQPSRQSDRIDRSKNVMDKAMELKERKNTLGAASKMSGIIRSNPFHVLQVEELGDMARKIGIHVDIDVVDVTEESDSLGMPKNQLVHSDEILDSSLGIDVLSDAECPRTPDQYNTDHEFDDRGENVWVHVTRKKRGKHPRKSSR
jgi:hypothetical protein